MLIKNMWHVAGFSAGLAPGKRTARRFLNEPVVLFRTHSGTISALTGRCSHRAMPLCEGHVDGEFIRSSDHGLEFGATGACARIPGQDRVPDAAQLHAYPGVGEDDFTCEDERAFEALQRRINDTPEVRFIGIASDGAVNRARMLLASMQRQESSIVA